MSPAIIRRQIFQAEQRAAEAVHAQRVHAPTLLCEGHGLILLVELWLGQSLGGS